MEIELVSQPYVDTARLANAYFTFPESLVAVQAVRHMDERGGVPSVTTEAEDHLHQIQELLNYGNLIINGVPNTSLIALSAVLCSFADAKESNVADWRLRTLSMGGDVALLPITITRDRAYARRSRTMSTAIGDYLFLS